MTMIAMLNAVPEIALKIPSRNRRRVYPFIY